MARIRTIKPEFFRHRRLYLAEREEAMPLRVAFAALWCCADREGRFRWEPEELKLDCLPFDDVDFSRVLHALATREFIVHFEVDGREYGVIPSFVDHQVINNKEAKSRLPAVADGKRIPHATCTREPRDAHARPTPLLLTQGEGKGKEGKGRERTSSNADASEADGDPSGGRTDPDKEPAPKRATSDRYDDTAWRKHVSAEVQELIDTLRREVLRASPETIFRTPEKQEVIAGNRLIGLTRGDKFSKTRLLFVLHAVPASDFWRGKVFTLATVEKNLSGMLSQTAKDWETWKDEPDPLAVFSWQQ